MNNGLGDGDDDIRVIRFESGRNNGRFKRGMCVVSNGDFERWIDVELGCCSIVGEKKAFERNEESDESLNDERRLSLKDLDDDRWFGEDFLSNNVLLSNVVWLLILLWNKLSLVCLFDEYDDDDADDIADFRWNKSSSSSHIWLNKSDKTGNIRWQRLHVRNCSIPLDKLPIQTQKKNKMKSR